MVSYKALNTAREDMVIQFLDGVGKRDGGQTDATPECIIS